MPENGKKPQPDWRWWISLAIMAFGWAYTLGIARNQLNDNMIDLKEHRSIEFHEGVRTLTERNGDRITRLEIQQARIEEKLNRILAIVEANH